MPLFSLKYGDFKEKMRFTCRGLAKEEDSDKTASPPPEPSASKSGKEYMTKGRKLELDILSFQGKSMRPPSLAHTGRDLGGLDLLLKLVHFSHDRDNTEN